MWLKPEQAQDGLCLCSLCARLFLRLFMQQNCFNSHYRNLNHENRKRNLKCLDRYWISNRWKSITKYVKSFWQNLQLALGKTSISKFLFLRNINCIGYTQLNFGEKKQHTVFILSTLLYTTLYFGFILKDWKH